LRRTAKHQSTEWTEDRSENVSEMTTQRSLVKGLLAGLVAGLAATAAKSIAEKFYPRLLRGEPAAPEIFADEFAAHPLNSSTMVEAVGSMHWGFGAAAGAAYGALAEFYPVAASEEGATFGLALLTLTHETVPSRIGVPGQVEEETPREQTSEAASHLLFGLVAERVRGVVRAMLG
jgi:putative membrane protein